MSLRGGILLLAAACALAGLASPQPARAEHQLAIEIPGSDGSPPTYANVSTNGGRLLLYSGLRRIANADPNQPQPSALQIEHKVQGDSVLMKVRVYYGDFDRSATPESLRGLKQDDVGTYTAKLNESITLSNMERFSLEPLTLRIVTAEPAGSVRPNTISKAASMQIDIAGEDRTFYKVMVHNNSLKAVRAFSIGVPEENGGGGTMSDGISKDLITPGGTHQVLISIPQSGTISNGTFVPNPPPALIVLQCALFNDGSYEGDPASAAEIIAMRMGREIQRERIKRVVASTLADADSDDDTKVERIRSETAKLTENPDPHVMDLLHSQFAGVPDNVLTRSLKQGMNSAKQVVDFELKGFERNRPPGSRDYTLANWWRTRENN